MTRVSLEAYSNSNALPGCPNADSASVSLCLIALLVENRLLADLTVNVGPTLIICFLPVMHRSFGVTGNAAA